MTTFPQYYIPIYEVKFATIVLGGLLALAIAGLIALSVLLSRRPQPEEFRREIRLAAPGAAPGSLFQQAFK
ncbi:unnamed protein product, partial [Protopolystoma xenopodis]